MSKSISLLTVCLYLVCMAQSSAQDPGYPDTLRIEPTTLIVGHSSPVNVAIFNDTAIMAFEATFSVNTVDGGFAVFDSVAFVGRMADPSVLAERIVNVFGVDGVSPDTLLVVCMRDPTNHHLLPGSGAVMQLYFTGTTAGSILIDSASFSEDVGLGFLTREEVYYNPHFVPTAFEVISGLPPELVVPDLDQVCSIGESVSFEVSASSPEGYPVEIGLRSVTGYDEDARLPSLTPVLSAGNPALLSWSPNSTDIGIWRFTFGAADSSGVESTREVTVQVVSSEDRLLSFEVTETEDAVYVTSFARGDFDNDNVTELFASAYCLEYAPYGVYDYDGLSALYQISGDAELLPSQCADATYINDDDYLDVVMDRWFNVTTMIGAGDNSFTMNTSQTSILPNNKGGTLTDFNGDAHLDYATAGVVGAQVFAGDGAGGFSEAVSFSPGDSAVSLSSADFDGDGRDDLAIGTRSGLEVYLNDNGTGYHLHDFYSQTFGSVGIEVTNHGSDLNNDGFFDLCIATPSIGGETSELMIYLGNGDGSFEQSRCHLVYGQILANRVGDFDGDGQLDIAFVNGTERYLSILFGNGAGGFVDEIRFEVPKYYPNLLDCLDVDLDGDLDIVVSSRQYYVGSSLFLYRNKSDNSACSRSRFRVQARNNADVEISSASGATLSRVVNSMSDGQYFRRDLDNDENLDADVITDIVESGAYSLSVTPRANLDPSETFSLEYSIDGRLYRLADVTSIPTEGRRYSVYPDGGSPVTPVTGQFVGTRLPTFYWPDAGPCDFELASDIAFTNVVERVTVSGGSHLLTAPLPETDSTIYYWRTKKVADAEWGEKFVVNYYVPEGCCGIYTGGYTGNANSSVDGKVTLSDVVRLIDLVYVSKQQLDCPENGNVNGSVDEKITLGDITALIDHIFISKRQTAHCPD